ncbi:MAG: phosphatidylglycerophosphatase A family protein [Polyangiaceae bacterium]
MSRASRGVAWVLATWFGCGLSRRAPGTLGTLGALPLYLVASRGGVVGVALAATIMTGAGIWAASVVADDVGEKDPSVVVIDEVAGLLVTMLPAAPSWRSVALGFVLFRVLDIAKPWPIRRLEALPGGWGIVMDDVAAGVAGAVVMGGLGAAGVLP